MDFELCEVTDPVKWWNKNWIFLCAMKRTEQGELRNFYHARLNMNNSTKKRKHKAAVKHWILYETELTQNLALLKKQVQEFMDYQEKHFTMAEEYGIFRERINNPRYRRTKKLDDCPDFK